jgi:menaquinone-dependent protoporphyrinogen IX oxidase
MQALIVYYSRSGQTRKVAEELAKALQCDVEEIFDTVNRAGPLGFLSAGRQAGNKSLTKLQPVKNDPSKYDLVIIGTPVWARHVSTPIRTYLAESKEKLKNVAFFCTEGSTGNEATFSDMEEVSGKKPKTTLVITAADLKDGSYTEKAKKFADSLKA